MASTVRQCAPRVLPNLALTAGDWPETKNSVWLVGHSFNHEAAGPSLGTRAVMGRRTRALPLVSAVLLGFITTSLGVRERRLAG